MTLVFTESSIKYPSCIKNYILNDPLIDYLQRNPLLLEKKQKSSNYTIYLESKKKKFIVECLNFFKEKYSEHEIIDLSLELDFTNKCSETLEAIKDKRVKCIIKGGLSKNNIQAIPELLLRKNGKIVVVDIRFMTLYFCKDNVTLRNSDYLWYCKCHLFLMNYLLPEPSMFGYMTVRKIRKISGDISYKEQLIEIIFDKEIEKKCQMAINWIEELEKNKHIWKLNPPSIPELYPNMKVKNESWDSLKNELAIQLKEISLVWNITIKQRKYLHMNDIYSWNHPKLFKTLQTKKTLSKILCIQQQFIYTNSYENKKLKNIIKNEENKKLLKKKNPIELFVDFETTMDLDENSQQININMTFMIGVVASITNKTCNKVYYKDFTVSKLTEEEEHLMFKRFIDFLNRLVNKYKINIGDIPIYHWSNAEKTFYKSAQQKYNLPNLNTYNWVDLYCVFKREPITLKNAWSFGLKNIAKILYEQGEIKTTWSMEETDLACDGADAMVRVLKLNEIAVQKNIPLKRLDNMNQIIMYNYVDCQVLLEILECLRKL